MTSSPAGRAAKVYPRPRGGTHWTGVERRQGRGLSPPTRGNLVRSDGGAKRSRSIPAHAGEPGRRDRERPQAEVYPRPRGGTQQRLRAVQVHEGLSPPTRGNLVVSGKSKAKARSIPAHAGEPTGAGRERACRAVYPRPRGGTRVKSHTLALMEGLSPPTRGNRIIPRAEFPVIRSIPAHAGEPTGGYSNGERAMVYPRPRGGTLSSRTAMRDSNGLSPPTRGNRMMRFSLTATSGSIPAHAGEPAGERHCGVVRRVYPRPRGGTGKSEVNRAREWGLSPPTRGNLSAVNRAERPRGSIPAHAGEPPTCGTRTSIAGVYPRPRGGTGGGESPAALWQGLSPPTRGNRTRADWLRDAGRSIPAHAGEPAGRRRVARKAAVYPRPRGGTPMPLPMIAVSMGLSPPTRGNQRLSRRRRALAGSIPAHAGEPGGGDRAADFQPVYPRPRGGTRRRRRTRFQRKGLSPPTRGNRVRSVLGRAHPRSIPAHAGEPRYVRPQVVHSRVYPRPRGGTVGFVVVFRRLRGLSPPTRGNLEPPQLYGE